MFRLCLALLPLAACAPAEPPLLIDESNPPAAAAGREADEQAEQIEAEPANSDDISR